ncbi:hypothetical protein QYF36_024053 [Acer negundo]|nr:hypothetical protein QYF36_024053 [Acer negundo]
MNENPESTPSRVDVWIRAHQKKNSESVNTKAAETIAKLNSIRDDLPKSSSMNPKEDALTKVLGPKKRGRGHNQSSESCEEVSTAPITFPTTMNVNPLNKNCKILDWMGSGEIVDEGRWSSSEPNALVHHVPIGPNAMRVWVDRVVDYIKWIANFEATVLVYYFP